MLPAEDFDRFFQEVHGTEAFPWQKRLLQQIASQGIWPSVLDLPTGSGKTATIDIAIFHLALEASRGVGRRAPVRIAFVVDRRLVVDDAFERARKLEAALRDPPKDSITARVAECLKRLALDGPPLIARRLRGGIPREDDWARTPSQPTVLCSTVDQVGSRLLFRGYGVSDSMKPVHAGLIGTDCLILLDEAHLAEPFRQTLGWVKTYKGASWSEVAPNAPWGVALLTATPGAKREATFALNDEDRNHSVLKLRLEAEKKAQLIVAADDMERERRSVDEAQRALEAGARAVGVVVNRVARARGLFETFRRAIGPERADLVLLIGPARALDRDDLTRLLAPIRTGARREIDKPLLIVATQCIEAGVDIDLDALVTDAAPLDCLRQRFGRLNRAGRQITPYAAIIATKAEVGARATDLVYDEATREAWKRLEAAAGKKAKKVQVVDFGLAQFSLPMDEEALSRKPDAPILMPAHLDLLSQTAPVPVADPDIALYLHGPRHQPDSVSIIWRADIDPEWADQDVPRLLTLVPPRSREAIELPLWTVRRWLQGERATPTDLADVSSVEPDGAVERSAARRAFRWKGSDESSRWTSADELRAGDTIIVPARYGGADQYGWHPESTMAVADVAHRSAETFCGRRFAVRVAPGLLGDDVSADALSDALSGLRGDAWETVRDSLMRLAIPTELKDLLSRLDRARAKRGGRRVEMYFDLYGEDIQGRPRGVVFVAPFGIDGVVSDEEGLANATEDDASGSILGVAVTLAEHSAQVEAKAAAFACAAGLSEERISDLGVAGLMHDEGKRDPRFQRWLHHGDPLGADPGDEQTILAKSGRALPKDAHEKAGLPLRWRHEALSVRLTRTHERLRQAKDPDLVLWLVGTHHGHGRPFYPHADPMERRPDVGPQSLAFDWQGMDWATLFQKLKARYGVWELARMEAILRLADHRASEEAAK